MSESSPLPLPHRHCPLCGGDNACAPAASGSFATPCWCRAVTMPPELLARVPEAERLRSCICPRCAGAGAPAAAAGSAPEGLS